MLHQNPTQAKLKDSKENQIFNLNKYQFDNRFKYLPMINIFKKRLLKQC